MTSPFSDSNFATSSDSNDTSLPTCQSSDESRSSSPKKLIFCYFQREKLLKIFDNIHHQKKVSGSKKSFSSQKSSSTGSSRFRSKRKKREITLLRTLVIILVCYLISTLPLGVFFIISFEETDKRHLLTVKILLMISLLNSTINPIIYIWRFKELRKSLKKLFCLL